MEHGSFIKNISDWSTVEKIFVYLENARSEDLYSAKVIDVLWSFGLLYIVQCTRTLYSVIHIQVYSNNIIQILLFSSGMLYCRIIEFLFVNFKMTWCLWQPAIDVWPQQNVSVGTCLFFCILFPVSRSNSSPYWSRLSLYSMLNITEVLIRRTKEGKKKYYQRRGEMMATQRWKQNRK